MTRRPAGFTVVAGVFAIVALLSGWELVAPFERALGAPMPSWWSIALLLELSGCAALAALVWRLHPLTLRAYLAWGALAIVLGAWYQHVVATPVLAFAQELGFAAPDRMPITWAIVSNVVNAAFIAAGYLYLSRSWPRGVRAGRPTALEAPE